MLKNIEKNKTSPIGILKRINFYLEPVRKREIKIVLILSIFTSIAESISLAMLIPFISFFINPDFYLSIMPPALPLHLEAVYISGFFEVLGGVGVLVPRLRKIAGWGLVALLVAVYPVNIYMALTPQAFPDTPLGALYFRLVLQFVFIFPTFHIL